MLGIAINIVRLPSCIFVAALHVIVLNFVLNRSKPRVYCHMIYVKYEMIHSCDTRS